MRIISKKQDFYDGLQDYSKDRLNKVFVREEKEVKVNKNLLEKYELANVRLGFEYDDEHTTKHNYGPRIWTTFLIVAGKVYPIISTEKRVGMDYVSKHYYDLESFYVDYPKYDKRWLYSRNFNSFFALRDYDATNLCLELNTPIVCIGLSKWKYEDDTSFRTIDINVNLKHYDFQKQFDAAQTYQIIDMFLSNVLVNDTMPLSPQTDIEKIESHGFDKKTSFRKVK